MTKTNKKQQIWAIAGGKGGTGKSLITASVGMYLAEKGSRVVVIDADFGGSNLHTFLSIKKPKKNLTNFFENRADLRDIIVGTSIPKLKLIAGNLDSLSQEDLKYTQKTKLFRHIKDLKADYILIDLGAGSHFNTLDTFLVANKMIIVTLPEVPSIENTYHFIKSVLFRKIKLILSEKGLKSEVKSAWKNKKKHGIKTLMDLIDYLRQLSPEVRKAINKEFSFLKMFIVLNKLHKDSEIGVGRSIRSIMIKYFGINTKYAGYIFFNKKFRRKKLNLSPSFYGDLSIGFNKQVKQIAENIKKNRSINYSV